MHVFFLSPINDTVLYAIGIYLIIVFFSSILTNCMLLLIFIRNRDLVVPINLLIITMTGVNLFGTIQFPWVIHSHFNSRLVFKNNIYFFQILKYKIQLLDGQALLSAVILVRF